LTEEARKNAEALVDLFDGEEKPPENHLFRAELFRQMGMCKEAIEELQKVQEPKLSDAVKRLRQLSLAEDSRLQLLYVQ
jgi:hypothetical protein